ncbi:bacteriohopanetetrol glucosamine biosynthesis glycosyltransferase HpnI [Telmatospirillum siberiense]|uniref:Glycosyl transferase n=1 Tax=Telmatospirillum siberiense TaxID=382514 RepID=A0A2N3PX76_9PROT|nr:bacteriohopanetetrol glucosamine biosynthesis glycosyltransferase HpnI [Telmatospirillum siberiense]PKU24988.1 glycosyl transferase [Telmatospirillum siberiense]
MSAVLTLAAWGLAGASLAGMGYQTVAVRHLRRFLGGPRPRPSARPAVSLLKPLCGNEPHLAGNLRSFRDQDYPAVQIVYGVADADDPALSAIARDGDASSDDRETIVVDPTGHGCNLKVGNLLNMLPRAHGEVLVIADSDVRVEPRYLDDVVAPLADPSVGLVTCLYVGRPNDGLWSRIGAMGINHGFLPSALVARAVGRHDGCFGATMALRRETLDSVGGLAPLQDILADDWALGAAVRRGGLRITLAARPVDIIVHEPDFGSLFAHEIRWGRTIAAVDRTSYMASVITQPVALAALAVLLGAMAWPFAGVLLAACAVRLWAIRAEERALVLPRAGLPAVALRELLSFVVFIVACCGRTVIWRGRRFTIRRDGTLESKEGIPT